jgi:hypothetical protein
MEYKIGDRVRYGQVETTITGIVSEGEKIIALWLDGYHVAIRGKQLKKVQAVKHER